MTRQRLLKWSHTAAAIGWAVCLPLGFWLGWQTSITFLFIASVWANVASHVAGVSGERPDQEVLEQVEQVKRDVS